MTTQVIDAENNVTLLETAPDKLRAEIGEYYGQILSPLTGEYTNLLTKNFGSGKIRSAQIEDGLTNDQVLIPIKRSSHKELTMASFFNSMLITTLVATL